MLPKRIPKIQQKNLFDHKHFWATLLQVKKMERPWCFWKVYFFELIDGLRQLTEESQQDSAAKIQEAPTNPQKQKQ